MRRKRLSRRSGDDDMILNEVGVNSENADLQLYRALSAGDLPAAYLISGVVDKNKTYSGENPATAFNRGLCLFLLEEYESALSELKRAEQLSGNPPEFNIAEKKLFDKALEISSREQNPVLLPLDPNSAKSCARYVLIRIKWLSALCLKALGRDGEASVIKRFLTQYNIEL